MISLEHKSPLFWRLTEHRTVAVRGDDDSWDGGYVVYYYRPSDEAILTVSPKRDGVGPGEPVPPQLPLAEVPRDRYEPEQPEGFPGQIYITIG